MPTHRCTAVARRIVRLAFAFVLVVSVTPVLLLPVDAVVTRTRSQMLHQHLANASVTVHYRDTLINIRAVNTSESAQLIARVPLKHFEFTYDSHSGRTQLGCLSDDMQALLPESVRVVPQRFVFDAARQRIALQDFAVVDKDALFMHNVAATQLVLRERTAVDAALQALQLTIAQHDAKLEELQQYLEQEASAQLVAQHKIALAEVARVEALAEEARVRGTEERATLTLKRDHELAIERVKYDFATQQLADDDALRRAQNRDLVALQEASAVRLELARRETQNVLTEKQLEADHARALLAHNTTLEKAVLDIDGRIRQQRVNRDIEMEQLHQTLEADRIKVLAALQATFDNLGRGATVLLTDTDKLLQLVCGAVALAAGFFVSREAVRIIGKLIEQRLGKPSLVRETSRTSGVIGLVRATFAALVRSDPSHRNNNELSDVVLSASLATRVLEIAKSTRNAIAHGAPYRHLLLYGPPGTGKTMVAKRLAHASGMEYAILSGGDVGPLGSDAVTELHALFHWATTSRRGVLIFIDEAEAFLGCRATRKTHMSEAMRNALNALLFHTGAQTTHFMLVIATNRPEDLDTAVTDRIDDTLHFDLPETTERVRLLQMYYKEYVGHMPTSSADSPNVGSGPAHIHPLETTAEAAMQQYGEMTDGMSGREIAKMMLYLQSIVYAQDVVVVTPALVDRVVREKVDEHRRKRELKHYKDTSGP